MYPNILCIGAQKAGTSWLYTNLHYHPEIWLPQRKEIHYFDRKFPNPEIAKYKHTFPNKNLSARERLKRYNIIISQYIERLKKSTIQDLFSEIRYRFALVKNDSWYSSLFKYSNGRITGDFTPAYSVLDANAVAYIRGIMPEVKIIFIMRDPIERAWSHAKMDLCSLRARAIENVSLDEFRVHFNGTESKLRGNYVNIMDTWNSFFPEEQLLLLFFDEIMETPRELMLKVFKFIGVTPSEEYIPNSINKKINIGEEQSIPDKLFIDLFNLYRDQMRLLADKFGNYPKKWLKRAENKMMLLYE